MADDDQLARRAQNLAAVEAAFAAVGRQDVDAQLANYTPDAVLEMPFVAPPAHVEGVAAIGERLRAAFSVFHMRLTIDRVVACTDPDELVVEFHSDGVVTTTGKAYRNRYIARFEFRDGMICFQREYFDPNAASAALAPD